MMCNPQDAKGKYLWWYLQSLEFHSDVAASTVNTNFKHLNLGPNMFEKPNKEAFYLVIHFLFRKLNLCRVQEVFRHCWPVLDHKTDSKFRKGAYAWLQEIASEEGSGFPKVVASHLLSPSGPRFVNLMIHLAKHVMLKTMKTFTTDGTWVPEAAAVPASSQELEVKRFHLVKKQFQRVSVEQDRLIQDYQRRARCLEKSLKDYKAENVNYDDLLKRYENSLNLESDLLEKINKVRSLWAQIDKALSSLEGEQSMLASVIEGKVDQYVLDGKELNVNVPAILLERMERLSHQTARSLYERGQLVIMQLLEFLNVGLSILSEERAKLLVPSSQLSYQTLHEQALLMKRTKDTLRIMRHKLAKEDIPQTKSSIKRLEVGWERKWAKCLGHAPWLSLTNEDPVLDFISPMAPLSFEPASEVSFNASIFSQYPAKLPDLASQTVNTNPGLAGKEVKDFVSSSNSTVSHAATTEDNISSCFASPRPVSAYMAHPKATKEPAVTPTPSPLQGSKRRPFSQIKTSAMKPRSQILELEYENLASQFAEAVTTMNPLGDGSNMELEQLLNTISDPFTTKKQIPRTPESLIMDVRTSWRKAVEEGKAEKKGTGHDSPFCLSTPTYDPEERDVSPERFSLGNSSKASAACLPCSPLASQQGTSLHSTAIWDSSQLETLSQNSSNIIHFSIVHETFPEADNDGPLNCSDGSQVAQETEKSLLPPFFSCSPEDQSLSIARGHFESPFTGQVKQRTSDFLPSAQRTSPGLGSGEMFALDLDQLESFSSPLREELKLPNLVTFSPRDEF